MADILNEIFEQDKTEYIVEPKSKLDLLDAPQDRTALIEEEHQELMEKKVALTNCTDPYFLFAFDCLNHGLLHIKKHQEENKTLDGRFGIIHLHMAIDLICKFAVKTKTVNSIYRRGKETISLEDCLGHLKIGRGVANTIDVHEDKEIVDLAELRDGIQHATSSPDITITNHFSIFAKTFFVRFCVECLGFSKEYIGGLIEPD